MADDKKPVEPSAPAQSNYDAMASAFDTLMEPSTPEDKSAEPAEPAPASAPAPAEAPPPAESPSPDTEGAEAAGAEPPVEEPAEEVDWKARFDELEARVAQQAQPAAAPREPEQPPPEPAPPPYSKEEQAFLTEYDKQWPDIVRGEALKRRVEYQQIVSHVFSEVARVYGPLIQQASQTADAVADTTTLAAIREAHPDYNDAMYDGVIAYANELTGMRRRIALATIEEGDVGDVVDLIAEYKTVKGLNKPKIVAAPSVTPLPEAAKKAAKALGVVESKRTATTTTPDPNDFDGAWEEAMRG